MSQNILLIFYLFKKVKTIVSLKAVQKPVAAGCEAVGHHLPPSSRVLSHWWSCSTLTSPSVWGTTTLLFSRWRNRHREGKLSSLSKVTQLKNVRAGIWTQVCLTPKPLTGILDCTDSHCILQINLSDLCFDLQGPHSAPSHGEGKMDLFFSKNHEDSKGFTIYLLSISGFCSIDHFSTSFSSCFYFIFLLLFFPFSWIKGPSCMWQFMEWGWELSIPDLPLRSCVTLGTLFISQSLSVLICKMAGIVIHFRPSQSSYKDQMR